MAVSAEETEQATEGGRSRIGLLYPEADPVSPAAWSGTPRGLADGLAANGVEVVPIGARLPFGIRQAVALASYAGGQRGAVADRMPVRQIARTAALAAELRSKGALSGVVAMGTEMYSLEAVVPRGIPCATYDDATLAQMWAHPDSDIRNSGFPEKHVQRWIARQAASSHRADLCCVSTAWAAESFVAHYGVARERVRVIGMGHRPREIPLRERDWSTPRYLFVGVDWKRKNGDMVLGAFREVRARIPEAVLSLVGESPQVDEPGVERYGFLPREDPAAQAVLDELYAKATCFVLPSRFDPSAIAYLEASSAGLPVIATKAGGSGELLGEAAVIVNPDDAAAITRAMLQLGDPQTAREAGALAAARAPQYSWQRIGQRLLDAVTSLRGRS